MSKPEATLKQFLDLYQYLLDIGSVAAARRLLDRYLFADDGVRPKGDL